MYALTAWHRDIQFPGRDRYPENQCTRPWAKKRKGGRFAEVGEHVPDVKGVVGRGVDSTLEAGKEGRGKAVGVLPVVTIGGDG